MEYCNLGKSGLEVSRIGLGAALFGSKVDEETSQQMFDHYFDVGGNLVDTANFYGGGLRGSNAMTAGTSERTVAKIIKGKRDQLVIATKGFCIMENDVRPNNVGLSRAYLTENIEGSLRRLETDYIDLYQFHIWDYYTPIEETLRVVDDFVRAGKIRYVGASNWDGWQMIRANMHATFNNLSPILSNQIWYNIADRGAENSIIPACQDQNVSVISWGALATGFLTGKYKRGDEKPTPGARLEQAKDNEMFSWKALAIDRNWETLDLLSNIAADRGSNVASVAIRWLLQSGKCDVVHLGASSMRHYNNNMGVLDVQLSDDEMAELTRTSEPEHWYPVIFHDLFCRRESEWYGGLR